MLNKNVYLNRVAKFFYTILFRFLKVPIFWFIFSLKLSLRLKIVLKITTLKRYCKATLNVFFYKKFFDDDKHFSLYGRFLGQIKILGNFLG